MKKKNKKSQSNISYEGKVTIKLMHGKKEYRTIKGHNSGRTSLFEFLSYCLAGTYINSKRPKYIKTFNSSNVIGEWDTSIKPTMNRGIPHSSIELETKENESTTIFTFLIPGYVFTSEDTNMLALYSDDTIDTNSNPLVYYYLGEKGLGSIDNDSNIIIIWEMTLTNKEVI